MKINKNIFLLFTFVTLFVAACSNNADIAAIVNGTKITKKTYKGTLDNLILQQKQNNSQFVDNEQTRLLLGKMALEQMITNEVLAQEAQKAKITVKEELVDQNVNNLKKLIAVDQNGKAITDKKQMDKKFDEKLKTDGITLKQLRENIRKELSAKLFLKELSNKQKVELSEDTLKRFYDATMAIVDNNQSKIKALPKEDLALVNPFAMQVKRATSERAAVSAVFLATPKTMSNTEIANKK